MTKDTSPTPAPSMAPRALDLSFSIALPARQTEVRALRTTCFVRAQGSAACRESGGTRKRKKRRSQATHAKKQWDIPFEGSTQHKAWQSIRPAPPRLEVLGPSQGCPSRHLSRCRRARRAAASAVATAREVRCPRRAGKRRRRRGISIGGRGRGRRQAAVEPRPQRGLRKGSGTGGKMRRDEWRK